MKKLKHKVVKCFAQGYTAWKGIIGVRAQAFSAVIVLLYCAASPRLVAVILGRRRIRPQIGSSWLLGLLK